MLIKGFDTHCYFCNWRHSGKLKQSQWKLSCMYVTHDIGLYYDFLIWNKLTFIVSKTGTDSNVFNNREFVSMTEKTRVSLSIAWTFKSIKVIKGYGFADMFALYTTISSNLNN